MCDVAEHDAKKEGKGDCGHNGRVNFLVAGCTVGVDNLLGNDGVRVGIEGGRRTTQLYLVKSGRRRHLHKTLTQQLYFIFWHVQLPTDNLLSQLKLIQCLVDYPLLPQEYSPALEEPDILYAVQKRFHLFLIHLHVVDHLIVLLSELLKSNFRVALHFAEKVKIIAECLHHSLYLLL